MTAALVIFTVYVTKTRIKFLKIDAMKRPYHCDSRFNIRKVILIISYFEYVAADDDFPAALINIYLAISLTF